MTMIDAIRNDELVGRGSCSVVDECYSDAELAQYLEEDGVKTDAEAIAWAKEVEGIHLECGLNQRWGADDDPQLQAWKEWNEKLEAEGE